MLKKLTHYCVLVQLKGQIMGYYFYRKMKINFTYKLNIICIKVVKKEKEITVF